METTAKFSINIVGEESGNPYIGDFTVKTLLTRADRFLADQKRREILGTNSEQAAPALQVEAFMLSQLLVRVVDSPQWWKDSNGGMLLPDLNVIAEIYNKASEKEDERKKELKKAGEQALEKIKNNK